MKKSEENQSMRKRKHELLNESSSLDPHDEYRRAECSSNLCFSGFRNWSDFKTDEVGRFCLPLGKKTNLVVLEKCEDTVVSFGVVDLLATLKSVNLRRCMTSIPGELYRSCSPIHVQQTNQWSCGYLNLQMMLSSISHLFSHTHRFFEIFPKKNVMDTSPEQVPLIPGLTTMQKHMEQSWKQGFDPKGAQHFEYAIVRKKAWIGGVEVASLLIFWHVDCTLIEFADSTKARKLLVPFITSYFSVPTALDVSSYEKASKHISLINNARNKSCTNERSHLRIDSESSHALPLYLQWDGHSVTVIGFEVIRSTYSFSPVEETTNLLVLDSLKDFSRFLPPPEERDCDDKTGSNAVKHGRSRSKFEQSIVESTRIPTTQLEKKDIQLVLASPKQLSFSDREKCRRRVPTIFVKDI